LPNRQSGHERIQNEINRRDTGGFLVVVVNINGDLGRHNWWTRKGGAELGSGNKKGDDNAMIMRISWYDKVVNYYWLRREEEEEEEEEAVGEGEIETK
jgi:hypothetical protein